MDRIERIREMEERLDRAAAAVRAMEQAAEAYRAAGEDLRALDAYLSSEERRGDLAADERGLLPPELKRGVLSEDGIYNLLEDDGELRRLLRALADPSPQETE